MWSAATFRLADRSPIGGEEKIAAGLVEPMIGGDGVLGIQALVDKACGAEDETAGKATCVLNPSDVFESRLDVAGAPPTDGVLSNP